MSIHNKFRILNSIIFVFFLLSMFTSYELSKGTDMVELNYKHTKYNHIFFDGVLRYESRDFDDLNILKDDILFIREQPVTCLQMLNPIENHFMRWIGTHKILYLCEKDIKDADRALAAIDAYEKGSLSQHALMDALNRAIGDFTDNSNKFDPLVTKTVATLFHTLIALGLVLGGCIIVLVRLITQAIRRDYGKMEVMSKNIQRLASFPENNPHPIVEINQNFEATYANPSFKTCFPHLDLGKSFENQLDSEVVKFVHKAFEEKKSCAFDKLFKEQWFDFYVDYIELGDGAFVRMFGHDITERKKAEEALQHVNVELEEFAYRTSHDLRSPIVSSVKLLSMVEQFIGDDDEKMALESLSYAQGALGKLDSLIQDILVLTEGKNKEEDDQQVDIPDLVEEALGKLNYMEGFARLDIQKDFQFKGALSTKKTRINMILENLISNAVKYQDFKKAQSYVHISTYEEDLSLIHI